MNLFRFFMDSSSWPMMQYKVSPIDSVWNPTKGLPVQLWKANVDGSPKLPTKVPKLVPYHPIWGHDAMRLMEKEKFISARLFKYMEF